MKNPFPKIDLVATPDSLESLDLYCSKMSGNEKFIAVLIASMTLNLAHKMFEEAAEGEKNDAH